MSRSVIVSGAGVVSAIGNGVQDFEEALFSGACGLGSCTLAETEGLSQVQAFEVPDFDARDWLGRKGLRGLDRAARLLCVAARLALDTAQLEEHPQEGGYPDTGLVNGTMFGSIHSIASFDWSGLVDSPKFVNPMAFPSTVINSPAGQAGIKFGMSAVNSTISAGLASGLCAIQYAAELLESERAQAILAGGAEQWSPQAHLGFDKNGLLSKQPSIRPMAEGRDGTVLGEGSALLVLEWEETARRRGLEPWAALAGFGESYDTASSRHQRLKAEGLVRAIARALRSADIEPTQIGLIVSGANGDRLGDAVEASALRQVFGEQLAAIPVSAPKASFGEVQGASGALLTLSAVLALRRGQAPPTPSAVSVSGGLSLSARAQPLKSRHALVLSYDCQGTSAALVLRG